jgi:hypothetical protein
MNFLETRPTSSKMLFDMADGTSFLDKIANNVLRIWTASIGPNATSSFLFNTRLPEPVVAECGLQDH